MQADGLGLNLTVSEPSALRMWKLAGSEPGSRASRAGQCKGMYLLRKDTVGEACFQCLDRVQLGGKVGDLEYLFSYAIHLLMGTSLASMSCT